jgi:hypothetical protein
MKREYANKLRVNKRVREGPLMEDGKKLVYAKFKMNSNLKIMDRMFVSESRSTVDGWRAGEVETEEQAIDKKEDELDRFQIVGRDFENSVNIFQRTVRFVMRYLPLMWRMSDDRNLRKFVAKHGEKIESGEF